METIVDNTPVDIMDVKFDQLTSILVLGVRASGKSVLTRGIICNLISHYDYHKIIIFSETAHINGNYDGLVDKKNIYNPEQSDAIFDKLKKYAEKHKKDKEKKYIICVYDDLFAGKALKSLTMQYQLSRHYNITVILCVQHSKSFLGNRLIRTNSYHTFISKMSPMSLYGLYEDMITPFANFDEFMTFYKQNIASSYNFLHYMLKPPEGRPQDTIQVVHADYDQVNNASIAKPKTNKKQNAKKDLDIENEQQ